MKILWCLHGNLQQPIVWEVLSYALEQPGKDFFIQSVSLWETLSCNCWDWANGFCARVRLASQVSSPQHYLLGYSLGGRLAWHALLAAPELWSGAMIVSADPGSNHGQLRQKSLERDRIWANRFLTEPWDTLLAEWDALPIFCQRPCPTPRPESAFDRQKLAHAFEAYSKGHMEELTERLSSLSVPITYITGSEDRHYSQLGKTLQSQVAALTHIEVKDAGHRVPWEQPDAFLIILKEVLELGG
ncbi:alpha/beta fold hydrolase [Leptothoe sp. PORK10 BA2]|uniref:alpha/beta fold hydrolase n=1 Tax=Leptothoe sp. PORK10 BA2 TaxID=3110254 RepID=UPI002B1ECE28|nr:alpha/beta fold hydrolase [Leptothoe sp. PORK10 BA2]MEA5466176.1 alpha/beta fold hydrolase [Leptothoe sp. PORK10 BA2]